MCQKLIFMIQHQNFQNSVGNKIKGIWNHKIGSRRSSCFLLCLLWLQTTWSFILIGANGIVYKAPFPLQDVWHICIKEHLLYLLKDFPNFSKSFWVLYLRSSTDIIQSSLEYIIMSWAKVNDVKHLQKFDSNISEIKHSKNICAEDLLFK